MQCRLQNDNGTWKHRMCLCVTHRESVDCSDLLPNGEYVEQGLGGVLPNPVPRVDHGLPTVSGGHLGGNQYRKYAHKCSDYALSAEHGLIKEKTTPWQFRRATLPRCKLFPCIHYNCLRILSKWQTILNWWRLDCENLLLAPFEARMQLSRDNAATYRVC